MSRARSIAKNVVAVGVVSSIAYFFYRAFERNWASIEAQNFAPNYWLLFAAALSIVVLILLGTYAWQLSINALSGSRKLTFSESVAAVNASALTKYIPGKIWSYALQMYWLAGAGIKMSLVLYVNLLSLAISLATSIVVGLVCLLLAPEELPKIELLLLLVLVVALDLLAVRFHVRIFRALTPLLSRLARRNVSYFEFSHKLLLQLHAIHFVNALVSGFCMYLMCLGIGYPLQAREVPVLVAASLLADVAGSLALIVPGGLGVREGILYLALGGASKTLLALVLPIASRLIGMVVDLLVGGVAFMLLRRFNRDQAPLISET